MAFFRRAMVDQKRALRSRFKSLYFMANEFSALTGRVVYKRTRPVTGSEQCDARRKEIALSPSKPGDENIVCHYGRKTSPYAYTCQDCQREFYLQCVEVKTPTKAQTIVCPNCGGNNLRSRSSA